VSPTPRKWRVVLVDDHTLFRDGLRTILQLEDDVEVIADVESAEDLVELVWQTKPDLVLLDICMPQGSGLDAVPAVVRINPETRVLVLTASDEQSEHVRALMLGAKGVVLKDSARQTLMEAIRTVCRGGFWIDPRMRRSVIGEPAQDRAGGDGRSMRGSSGLTDRELEIVRLVASGQKNKEVSAALAISERTVKAHLQNIFQKLGLRDRVALVMYALQRGLTQEG
jgi:DNA-binding NarL/FixJ family response regulator